MGKNAFLRYLVKTVDLRQFPGEATSWLTCTSTNPSSSPSPPPPRHAQGLPFTPLLWTLQVLQDPGQLHARLPLLADSPEFSLHGPGERKIGLPEPTVLPSRATPPSLTPAVPWLCDSSHQIPRGHFRQCSQPRQVGSDKDEAKSIPAVPPSSLSPGALLDGPLTWHLGLLHRTPQSRPHRRWCRLWQSGQPGRCGAPVTGHCPG